MSKMDMQFNQSMEYKQCNDHQQYEYNDHEHQQYGCPNQQYGYHNQQYGSSNIFYGDGPYLPPENTCKWKPAEWSTQTNANTATPAEKENKSVTKRLKHQTSAKAKKVRTRKPEEWRGTVKKKSRNSGQEYEMWTKEKKYRPSRCVKEPCSEKCRLKCFSKFTKEQRNVIFTSYWSLANIEKQRQFIMKAMDVNVPRYRYVREGGTRAPRHYNMQYYFYIDGEPIKVCKTFFMNTLDINSRIILTVLKKTNKLTKDVLEEDKRGKHGKQPKVKAEIRDGIKAYMEMIPTVPSFCAANTKTRYVAGYKTVVELYKDYVNSCQELNREFGKYGLFYRLFHTEYNLSIMASKLQQCELCYNYENASETQKIEMRKKYTQHILTNEFAKISKSPEIQNNSTKEVRSKTIITPTSSHKNDKKRICKPEEWQRNVKSKCRNTGKEYEMGTKDKKTRPGRCMKEPCSEKCRLKCFDKFTADQRLNNFKFYWSLGNIDKQRQYLLNLMLVNKPRYRYAKGTGARAPRDYNLHYFLTNNDEPIQVCKLFFMNTLDINARNIITVLKKSNKLTQLQVEEDLRGKHGNHHKAKPEIRDGIMAFVKCVAGNSECHVGGIKNVKQLHKDYVERCQELQIEYGSYAMFYRIFNAVVKKDETKKTNSFVIKKETSVEAEIQKNISQKIKLINAKKLAKSKAEAKQKKSESSTKRTKILKAKKPRKVKSNTDVTESLDCAKTLKVGKAGEVKNEYLEMDKSYNYPRRSSRRKSQGEKLKCRLINECEEVESLTECHQQADCVV